ncbi:hypothetical protein AVEN_125121-1 [Araneus ventricosus]|uniref:G-protein coupled receptors family 1 profile domain-containing protein n=1 Tax=Araneus ventricosus TaxID=182803 RepID=A0A4Y2FS13_ARAVE|nr:hypothetical protein AVEN_125121-1 [Araneus ventricosus]
MVTVTGYKYINLIWFSCHLLAMSNSCYNPFIYAMYNKRFNAEFKNRFGCCFSIFRKQRTLDSSSARYG